MSQLEGKGSPLSGNMEGSLHVVETFQAKTQSARRLKRGERHGLRDAVRADRQSLTGFYSAP